MPQIIRSLTCALNASNIMFPHQTLHNRKEETEPTERPQKFWIRYIKSCFCRQKRDQNVYMVKKYVLSLHAHSKRMGERGREKCDGDVKTGRKNVKIF